MFTLTFRYKFEAAHRFTKSCAFSCATPHGHTWYATATIRALTQKLAADDMVVEFGKLKKQWKVLIDEVFDHSFMHNVTDPLLDAIKLHVPHARLMPFPGDPTTELIAILLHAKMTKFIEANKLLDLVAVHSVKIDETPTNSVTWEGALHPSIGIDGEVAGYDGWWSSADPLDRGIRTTYATGEATKNK